MMSIKCLFLILAASGAFGMKCSLTGSDFIDHLLSCPLPLQDSSKSYCCPTGKGSFECCSFPQFILTPPILGITVVILGITVSILIVRCVVFACCSFCRSRSQGRVLNLNAQSFGRI